MCNFFPTKQKRVSTFLRSNLIDLIKLQPGLSLRILPPEIIIISPVVERLKVSILTSNTIPSAQIYFYSLSDFILEYALVNFMLSLFFNLFSCHGYSYEKMFDTSRRSGINSNFFVTVVI